MSELMLLYGHPVGPRMTTGLWSKEKQARHYNLGYTEENMPNSGGISAPGHEPESSA